MTKIFKMHQIELNENFNQNLKQIHFSKFNHIAFAICEIGKGNETSFWIEVLLRLQIYRVKKSKKNITFTMHSKLSRSANRVKKFVKMPLISLSSHNRQFHHLLFAQ